MADPVDELIEAEGLPGDYRQVVEGFWQPIAHRIARHAASTRRPLTVGITGSPDGGRSSLCAFLELLLARRQLRAETLALDDLSLTRAERDQLAHEVHPLFSHRGIPGTHAPALGLAVIDHIRAGRAFDMPRFDMQRDDRSPYPDRIEGPVDVLLLEGWCVGARPQADEDLLEPVNAFERKHDPDGIWRSVANLWLRGDYRSLFEEIDLLVMLLPVDDAALHASGNADFRDRSERWRQHMFADLSRRADIIVPVDANLRPQGEPSGIAANEGRS